LFTIIEDNNNENKKPLLTDESKQKINMLSDLLTTDKNDPKFKTLQDELNHLGINITSPENGYSPEVDALLLEHSPLNSGKKNNIRD